MASGRGSVLGAVATTRILTNTTPSIRWTWNVQDRCSSNSEDPGQSASCNQSPDCERHLEMLQLVSVFRVLQTVQRWLWDGDGLHCGGPGFRCLPKEEQWRLQVQPEHVARVDHFTIYSKIAQTGILQFITGEAYFCVFWLCGFSSSQMWLLLHGGGTRPSRHLQHHPHHLPAQTGRTLFLGFCQHLTSQGLPAPMKMGGVSAEVLWDVPEAEVWICSTDEVFSMEESVISEELGRGNSIWNKSWQLWGIFTELCFCHIDTQLLSEQTCTQAQDRRSWNNVYFNLLQCLFKYQPMKLRIKLVQMSEFLENHSRAEMFESDIFGHVKMVSFSGVEPQVSGRMMSLPVALCPWESVWRYKCKCVAKKRSIIDVYFFH